MYGFYVNMKECFLWLFQLPSVFFTSLPSLSLSVMLFSFFQDKVPPLFLPYSSSLHQCLTITLSGALFPTPFGSILLSRFVQLI